MMFGWFFLSCLELAGFRADGTQQDDGKHRPTRLAVNATAFR